MTRPQSLYHPSSASSDSSLTRFQGQRFGTEIFAAGFESNDASAWSGAVP